ncbi:MAG: ABC transporter substrate-binding protein, partial [Actinobacteria bacterium]|nr:ABC transporter substrate-binding protein [Actinomycetota bacterium]
PASSSSAASTSATPTPGSSGALAAPPTPSAPTPTPQPTPAAINKGTGTKSVLIWHNYTLVDYTWFSTIIDDFISANPDYKVDAEYVATSSGSQENEKLVTAIAGGKPPDVAEFDRFIVGSFAFRGALNDITSMAKTAGIAADQYLTFAWDEASLRGKLYALPIDTDARALYYRKDFFDSAGIKTMPQNPTDLATLAGELTTKNGSQYSRFGFLPAMDQGMLYTWGWVWGGSFYDQQTQKVTANDPKIVDALTWMVSFAQKYGEENMVSFQTAFGQGAQSPFIAGLVAMDPNGNWEIAQIDQYSPNLSYGIIPYPGPAGTKPTTWSGGWSWTIPNGSKNVDNGFALASFITNEAEMLKWCKNTQHYPTRTQALKDPFYSQGNQKVFTDLLPNSHNRPVIPEGNLLWNDLLTATSNAMYGKVTPKAALDDVTNTVNNQLQKDGWFK